VLIVTLLYVIKSGEKTGRSLHCPLTNNKDNVYDLSVHPFIGIMALLFDT